jgi:hypothetical protein
VPINSVYQDSIRTLKITSNDYMASLMTSSDGMTIFLEKNSPIGFFNDLEITKNGEKIYSDGNKQLITFSENITKSNRTVHDSFIYKIQVPINSVYQDSIRTLKITSNDYIINYTPILKQSVPKFFFEKDTPISFLAIMDLTKNGEIIYPYENGQKITFSEDIHIADKSKPTPTPTTTTTKIYVENQNIENENDAIILKIITALFSSSLSVFLLFLLLTVMSLKN